MYTIIAGAIILNGILVFLGLNSIGSDINDLTTEIKKLRNVEL